MTYNFSKKSTRKLYSTITMGEKLPIELQQYQNILTEVCQKTPYTPKLKDFIISLALATKNNQVVLEYLYKSYKESLEPEIFQKYENVEENFNSISRTRYENFNLDNSNFEKLVETYQATDVYNSHRIDGLDDFVIGISTDYEKVQNEKSNMLNNAIKHTVGWFISAIIKNEISKQEIENLRGKTMSAVLADELIDLYDELANMRNTYKEFTNNLGLEVTPLSNTVVFIRDLITYHLTQENNLDAAQISAIISGTKEFYETADTLPPLLKEYINDVVFGEEEAKKSFFKRIDAGMNFAATGENKTPKINQKKN